jgi:hypothetical protein
VILEQSFQESKPGKHVFTELIQMADPISKENVNVKLPTGLHQRVKAAAITRTGTTEKAYAEALESWLSSPAASQKAQGKSPIEFPSVDAAESKNLSATFSDPANRRLAEMLATVLKSGVSDAINAVTENLKVFSKYVKGEPPDENSGTEGPRRRRK